MQVAGCKFGVLSMLVLFASHSCGKNVARQAVTSGIASVHGLGSADVRAVQRLLVVRTRMVASLLPFLIGVIPIFLARTWPARFVAIGFAIGSVALFAYMGWAINNLSDVSERLHHSGIAVVTAFAVAIVSLVATYIVDRKYGTKA